MRSHKIFTNAFMSIIQTVVVSVTLFVLYRFLLNTIGAQQFGIWALVLSISSVANIANFGLSGSVVKFVAKYTAHSEFDKVSKVIQTAVIFMSLFVGIFLLLGYPIIKRLLGVFIPSDDFNLALSILPQALFALWMMTITAVIQSGIDGMQRIDLRSFLLMAGAVFHLILCLLIVPKYGLVGLAYARIAQNVLILFLSWVFLRKHMRFLPIIPNKWDRTIFSEIVQYGVKFQAISLTRMFFDPLTKMLLSRFGGLSMVGYFEMASRLIMQLQSLIASANQVLVPAIAEFNEKASDRVFEIYQVTYNLVFYLGLSLFTSLFIVFPVISKIWIGSYEKTFIASGIFLTIGWFINSLSIPSYFVFLGIGRLSWNLISHISIAVLNVLLGTLFGTYFGGIGVIFANMISLIIGSIIIFTSYHLDYKISFKMLIPRDSIKLLIVCLVCGACSFWLQFKSREIDDITLLDSFSVFIFVVIIFFSIWFHPMRRQLASLIKQYKFIEA